MCSHFVWKRGGKTQTCHGWLCDLKALFLPLSLPPGLPCGALKPFTAGSDTPALHGSISLGSFAGPSGTPASRTRQKSPSSPPMHLVQQRWRASSNGSASIDSCHVCHAFGGFTSQVRDKKEFLEIRVPAVSAPVITRVSNVYPERTRQSGAVPAWQVPVNLCSPRGDTDQLLD